MRERGDREPANVHCEYSACIIARLPQRGFGASNRTGNPSSGSQSPSFIGWSLKPLLATMESYIATSSFSRWSSRWKRSSSNVRSIAPMSTVRSVAPAAVASMAYLSRPDAPRRTTPNFLRIGCRAGVVVQEALVLTRTVQGVHEMNQLFGRDARNREPSRRNAGVRAARGATRAAGRRRVLGRARFDRGGIETRLVARRLGRNGPETFRRRDSGCALGKRP